jgi:opacity protein-like surface antigen
MRKNTAHICFQTLILLLCFSSLQAGEKPYRIGFQMGPFIPHDWQVQGGTFVSFDPDGSVSNGAVEGFGNGLDLVAYGEYRFGSWWLRADGGGRLLIRGKFDLVRSTYEQHYENRLIIYPFTLSLIHRGAPGTSFFRPYFGVGGGIYFADWEEKYSSSSQYSYVRAWYEGSATPLGLHALAGVDYRVWKNLYLNFEYRYSYVEIDWELKDQDTDERRKLDDVGIGGTSLKLGLGYGF